MPVHVATCSDVVLLDRTAVALFTIPVENTAKMTNSSPGITNADGYGMKRELCLRYQARFTLRCHRTWTVACRTISTAVAIPSSP